MTYSRPRRTVIAEPKRRIHVCTPIGALKLLTIILGGVSLVIGAHSYLRSLWTEVYSMITPLRPYLEMSGTTVPDIFFERFFLIVMISCWVVSFVYLIVHCLESKLATQKINKILDTTYHIVGGLLIVLAGCFYTYSGAAIESFVEETSSVKYYIPGAVVIPFQRIQLFEEKLVAGVLAIFTGLAYWGTAAMIVLYKREEDTFTEYRFHVPHVLNCFGEDNY